MENARELFLSLFAVDSIWSVVFRAGIWFAIALVIIVSTDVANPQKSTKSLKSNLGFFLLFLVVSGGLIYLLFGFTTVPKDAVTAL
jgi:hypothetical protein